METLFKLSDQSRIELGTLMAKGGQGEIYCLKKMHNILAKIYLPNKAPLLEKLLYMYHNPPHDPTDKLNHKSIAWVEDIIVNATGELRGIIIPEIKGGVNLYSLIIPRERLFSGYQNFSWQYLYRTAVNISAIVGEIHKKGYVIGDINESNFLVQNTSLVTIIDCDSIQVKSDNGKIFLCEVGKHEFTPPEVTSFKKERTKETDRFGLGVLIFQLLMEGSHPFRGTGEPTSLKERIKEGCFPYPSNGYTPKCRPAIHSMPIEYLPSEIVDMFYTCFVNGHNDPSLRPSANKWYKLLKGMEPLLQKCSKENNHVYFGNRNTCPWCERKKYLEGYDPFEKKKNVRLFK